jgi:hypothetical protein
LPTSAVTAIATAPQKVTRATPRQTDAPPALAPIAPRTARKIKDSTVTQRLIIVSGTSAAVASGSAAPTAKVRAEAPAATSGFASVCSEIPSSSRTCAPSASLACSAAATSAASSGGTPRRSYMPASARSSSSGSAAISAASRVMSAFSVSAWLLTETYSPAAIDSAPAASPAIPAISTSARPEAAATPTISEAVDTIPSFAPRTAARSQPTRAT